MKKTIRTAGLLLAALLLLSCFFGGCSSGNEKKGIKDRVIKQASKVFEELNKLSSDYHRAVNDLYDLALDEDATETDYKVAVAVGQYSGLLWNIIVYDKFDSYCSDDPDFMDDFTFLTEAIINEDDEMVLYDKGEKVIDKAYELTCQWFESPFGTGGP